ncbi:MAG: glycosyltransferase [Parachlamydiaceae bacterium]|nr:glycosyltransferase [Parachlamydiaceae bacterium]
MKNSIFIFFLLIYSTFLTASAIYDNHLLELSQYGNTTVSTEIQERRIEPQDTLSHDNIISTFVGATTNNKERKLTFNVISSTNGVGLEVDQKIMTNALKILGHNVQSYGYRNKQIPPKADINIFFQAFKSDWFSSANQNWFVPNPEWYIHGANAINDIDLILCRTKEVERIFSQYTKNTYFLGFTSKDCYSPHLSKDFQSILHLAGKSVAKGTSKVVEVWRSNPQFPVLHLITQRDVIELNQSNYHLLPGRLDEETLRMYQNTCGIHLCPSETEGFGHYLVESMSAGAVVVTTNAPPMNEFITDPRCLVKYEKTKKQRFGINYYVDPKDLEKVISNLLKLSPEELRAIGKNNRKVFLENEKMFHIRLKKLLESDLMLKEKTTTIIN